jgi:hypothetical protein
MTLRLPILAHANLPAIISAYSVDRLTPASLAASPMLTANGSLLMIFVPVMACSGARPFVVAFKV